MQDHLISRPEADSPAREARSGGVGLPRHRVPRARIMAALYPTLAFIVFLAFWEGAVRAFAVPTLILPPPSAIVRDIIAKHVMYWEFSVATFVEVALGFIVAFGAGLLLGVVLFFSLMVRRTIYPLLVSSQMVPKVAVAPVLVIWLGTGLDAKVAVAFLIAFFPIMLATMVGLAAVDPDMVKLFRSMRASPLRTFIKLRVPAALPNLFAGLKIGMIMAVVGAVVAEFVAADRGLGYYLLYANGQL
ncbi:MAG: ABC transporter permease, partial [Acetobacteraceae bacterium]